MCHVPSAFQYVHDEVMIKVKIWIGRKRERFSEDGREWRLPSFLYTDDFVLHGELGENLRVKTGRALPKHTKEGVLR